MNDRQITRTPAVFDAIVQESERRNEFMSVKLAWASGLMIVVRKAVGER